MSNFQRPSKEEIVEVSKIDTSGHDNADINNVLHGSPLDEVTLNEEEKLQIQNNDSNHKDDMDPVCDDLGASLRFEKEGRPWTASEFNDSEFSKKLCRKFSITAEFFLQLRANIRKEVDFDVRNEMLVYYETGSLDAVPLFACPFGSCRRKYKNIPSLMVVAEDGVKHCTIAEISRFCMAQQVTRFPSMKSKSARITAFKTSTTFEHSEWPDFLKLASAGFFSDGKIIKCYKCALEFPSMDKMCNPLREHARWSPCCAFLRSRENGDLFIHKVLEDTKDIIQAQKERRETMELGVIEECIKENYDPVAIVQAISTFFFKYGGYPSYPKLITMMEDMKQSAA